MILRDALRSIKKDPARAFFYWFTFVLTSMFIFLFFNISMSDPKINPFDNTGNIITWITILVIVLCSIDIIFANDFYVKAKGKDMAIRLICGATYIQLAGYLLTQTFLLLLFAVPLGIGIATVSLPLVNKLMFAMTESAYVISIQSDAIQNSLVIILYVIAIATLLNLSFAYKSAAGMMMNKASAVGKTQGSVLYIGKSTKLLRSALWIILFAAPIALFYYNRASIAVFAGVGLFGFTGLVDSVLGPGIGTYVRETKANHPRSAVSLGFIRRDIQVLKINIVLFLFCAIIFSAVLVMNLDGSVEMITILITYVVMTFLQGLALMFKLSTELADRGVHYAVLNHLGFMPSDQRKILNREVFGVYGFILLVALLYILNIFASYIMAGELNITMAFVLLGFLLLPLFICCIANWILYRKAVLPKHNEMIKENKNYSSNHG